MGIGLGTAAIVALGCAFAAWQHVSAWTAPASRRAAPAKRRSSGRSGGTWLLLSALALTGISLLTAL